MSLMEALVTVIAAVEIVNSLRAHRQFVDSNRMHEEQLALGKKNVALNEQQAQRDVDRAYHAGILSGQRMEQRAKEISAEVAING